MIGTVGEPINPSAWRWLHKVVGEGRAAIVDTYWQTETVSTVDADQDYRELILLKINQSIIIRAVT